MAQPIPFHAPPFDSREALRVRVEQAPDEHAEAILAAYDLLQALHDRGILDTIASAVRASDEMLEKIVADVNTPEAIRALRNLVFWQKILGSIEPKWFKGLFQAIPDGLAAVTAERDQPVGVWRLVRRALSKDSLRGLAAGLDFLESFGRHLHMLEASARRDRATSSREG
jgi:uncharacterized protein YjgD (DUF1641 family)